jgi:hypothetical protein
MDILTLELYEVTVSEALREVQRVLEAHPSLPLRILLGGDGMLHHNLVRFLERNGRSALLRAEGSRWRIEVGGHAPARATALPAPARPLPLPASLPAPVAAQAAPQPEPRRPILLTRSSLGQGSAAIGRRLLLGVLRELDRGVPWLCLALEGLELLDDPQALRILEAIQAQGTPVRISRESQLFPTEAGPFEVMEDSHWQRLAGRGEIIIL